MIIVSKCVQLASVGITEIICVDHFQCGFHYEISEKLKLTTFILVYINATAKGYKNTRDFTGFTNKLNNYEVCYFGFSYTHILFLTYVLET